MERVILLTMLGSEIPAVRTALLRPVPGWGCVFLLGMVGCDAATPSEGSAALREEPAAPGEEAPPLVASPLADAFAPLIEDALAQPEEARPYLRYVLASRGVAAFGGELERLALLRLVNSVSLSPQITAPAPLAELSAYRLDLRDYLWDRPVSVGGVSYPDGWEAIVEHSGLALPPLPDEPLAALTGTTTAVLPARAFLTAASSGPVYYALTNAPGFEYQLQEGLAAQFPDWELDEKVYNAVLPGEKRHGYQGARRLFLPDGSAYWQGLPDTPRGNALFYDPFDFNSWETDAIYPLPNGLPGFFLDTPFLQPRESPAPLTRLQGHESGPSDELVADCIACHSNGPARVEDVYLDYIRNNDHIFDSEMVSDILSHWPSQEDLDTIVAADSAAYDRTLASAGLSIESAGALQAITRRYASGLDLQDMAAALHASEAQLRAVLPAGTTTIDAETFRSDFRSLLCVIHPDASAAAYCDPGL